MTNPASGEPRKPIARCLGEAVGHLVQAVKAPVRSDRVVVDRRSETREHRGLLLRRTVIDEVEPLAPRRSEDSDTPAGANRPGNDQTRPSP